MIGFPQFPTLPLSTHISTYHKADFEKTGGGKKPQLKKKAKKKKRKTKKETNVKRLSRKGSLFFKQRKTQKRCFCFKKNGV